MNKKRVLIVDDEPDILEICRYNIEKTGEYEVFLAANGVEGIEMAKSADPHLILMDIMMPEMDGIETCKQLRSDPQFQDTLIAFLTARSEDYDVIEGLEHGGDDYITKPISPQVLVSRIQALLRRSGGTVNKTNAILTIGDLTINKDRFMVKTPHGEVYLVKKEFDLLNLLVSKPGKVFTREEILDALWGDDVIVGDRTIDVHVRKIRQKLGSKYIKTVKGVGYKFVF